MFTFKDGFIQMMKKASTALVDVKSFTLTDMSLEKDGEFGKFGGESGRVVATVATTNSFDEVVDDALHAWSPALTKEVFDIFVANYESLIEDAEQVKLIKAMLLDPSITGEDAKTAALARLHDSKKDHGGNTIYYENGALVIFINSAEPPAIFAEFHNLVHKVVYDTIKADSHIDLDKFFLTTSKEEGLQPSTKIPAFTYDIPFAEPDVKYFDYAEHPDYIGGTAYYSSLTPFGKLDTVYLEIAQVNPTVPYYLGQLTFDDAE